MRRFLICNYLVLLLVYNLTSKFAKAEFFC